MQIALVVYHVRRHGGRERHLRSLVAELLERGHQCRIYTSSWQGQPIDNVDVRRVPVRALRQHRFEQRFHRWLAQELAADPVDRVVGLHKMPGLDVYFASDSCYLDTVMRERSALYRRGARYAHYVRCERAVFAPPSKTTALLHSARTGQLFVQYYGTESVRMHYLPPGVPRDCAPGSDAPQRRKALREALSLDTRDITLLFIASSFRDKGLERVLHAQAQMRLDQPNAETRLLVVGDDKPARYRRLARRLGIGDAVNFLGPRDDVRDLMQAADALVHPAVSDAAGSVLLEALVAGLPVLTTAICGCAEHIASANAGIVLREPFSQRAMNEALARFVDGAFRARCADSGLRYAGTNDLHSMYIAGADFILQAPQDKLAAHG